MGKDARFMRGWPDADQSGVAWDRDAANRKLLRDCMTHLTCFETSSAHWQAGIFPDSYCKLALIL
jgi:hypothetical protein